MHASSICGNFSPSDQTIWRRLEIFEQDLSQVMARQDSLADLTELMKSNLRELWEMVKIERKRNDTL